MDVLKAYLLEAARWDYDEFQRVWNAAQSREEVAKHFGITPELASVRAQQLRGLDYELKVFPRGRKLGQKLLRPSEIEVKLPPKEMFIQMWNEDPSVNRLTAKLLAQGFEGVTANIVRQKLIDLKKAQGATISRSVRRGPTKKFDLDPRTLEKIWEASDDLDQVVEKVQELGFDATPKELRTYITAMVHRINVLRRAKGVADLKKMPRPTYHRQAKFSDDLEASAADIELDAELAALDQIADEPAAQGDEWDEKTPVSEPPPFDDIEFDDVPFESPPEEDPDMASGNREFEQLWNAAESFKDARRALRRAGWELSPDEIREKAKELRNAGVNLKKFS